MSQTSPTDSRRRLIGPALLGLAAVALLVTAVVASAVSSSDGEAGQGPQASPTAVAEIEAAEIEAAEIETAGVPDISPPPMLGDRRDLVDLDAWLNTDIDSLDDLDGQVVIVEFWTFGCFNCKNRIPYTQQIYRDHHNDGLEIVGVHAPEFSYEADPAAIAEATQRLGVSWPVALDTEKKNFRLWQPGGRRFWPRTFVIDRAGQVRYDHIGEGDYDGLADVVAWLLAQ